MQRLQNAATRLISNVPRYSNITPICSLHWVPVKFRVDFKIPLPLQMLYAEKSIFYSV